MSRKKYERKYYVDNKEVSKQDFFERLQTRTTKYVAINDCFGMEYFDEEKFHKTLRKIDNGVGMIYCGVGNENYSFRIIKKEVK